MVIRVALPLGVLAIRVGNLIIADENAPDGSWPEAAFEVFMNTESTPPPPAEGRRRGEG
jgi:hypothetical protein